MNIKYENGLFEVKDNGTEYIGDGVNWQEKKMSDKGFLTTGVKKILTLMYQLMLREILI